MIDIQYVRDGLHVCAINVDGHQVCHMSVAFTQRGARRKLIRSIDGYYKEENKWESK